MNAIARDLVATLGIAAVTATFTLAWLGSGRVEAVSEKSEVTPIIAQPQLALANCVVSLKSDRETYTVGEKPVLSIEATNPTDEPVTTSVWLNITAISPASMMSRVPVLPQTLWSQPCPVTLAAGETKTITVTADTPLPADKTVSITMSDKQQQATVAKLLSLQGRVNGQSLVAGSAQSLNLADAQ